MNVYLARVGEEILDLAVRAADQERATALIARDEKLELSELRADVAKAMGVPEGEGVHAGVVWRWILGPTNLLGELPN